MSGSEELPTSSGAKRGAPPSNDDGFMAPPPKKTKRAPMPDLPDPMIDDEQSSADQSNRQRSRRRDSVPATPISSKTSERRRHSSAPRTARKKIRDCDLVKEVEDLGTRVKQVYEHQFDVRDMHRRLRAAIQANKFEEKRFLTARQRFEEECDLLKQRVNGTEQQQQLQQKFDTLEANFNTQQSLLQDAQSQREVTEKASDDLRKQNGALRAELGQTKLAQQQLELKLNKAKGTNTKLKTATQNLSENRDKLQAEVADARAKAQMWEEKFKLFQTMHNAVQRELTALKEEKERRAQGEVNSSFVNQADELAKAVRDIQEQCNKQVELANDQAHQKVQEKLDALTKQVKKQQVQVVNAQTQAHAAKAQMEQAVQQQALIARQMDLLKKQKADLETENAKYVERETEYTKEIMKKNALINDLRTKKPTPMKETYKKPVGRVFHDDVAVFEKLLGSFERFLDMEETKVVKRQEAVTKFLSKQQAEAMKQREVAECEAAEARAQFNKFMEKAEQARHEDTTRAPMRFFAQHQPASPLAPSKKKKAEIDPAETRSKTKKSRLESASRASIKAA